MVQPPPSDTDLTELDNTRHDGDRDPPPADPPLESEPMPSTPEPTQLSAPADAHRGSWSFKLVSQRPAVHKNRTLHERTQLLGEKMATCGKLEVTPAPMANLHVASDGTMSKIELVQAKLSAEQSECIRDVFSTLTYPPHSKPSVVTWVVLYK